MTSTSFFSNKNDKKLLLKILEEWDKITDIEFLKDVQKFRKQ